MKPKGLLLKTHIRLLTRYVLMLLVLFLPTLITQTIVIAALTFVICSQMSRTGKIAVFSVVLLFGEGFVATFAEMIKDDLMSYKAFRIREARETTDERLREELRRNDRNEEVRAEAIRKDLGAQMLIDIALNEVSRYVRISAAVEIEEPNDMEALIRASGDPWVRKAVLWKIRNEALLREYALNDGSEEVRVKAVEFIHQPGELETLLRASGDPKVREIAATKVKNEALLREVALSDPNIDVRIAAAKNIKSPDILLEIIADTDKVSLWRLCLPKLIRNSKVDGILPESIQTALRNAKYAEQLLKLPVCPDCGGEVEYREEYRDVDIDNISEYDDDPTLVEFWQFYICRECGREESKSFGINPYDPGFSMPLGSLLTRK